MSGPGIWQQLFSRPQKNKKSVPAPLPEQIDAIRQRAERGHHLDQVLWGKVLLNSAYIQPDHSKALVWFTMAANAGYGPAHNMLGRCHHFSWGCEEDLQQAARHYETAASLGDEWGRYNLGILTMRGLGIPRDMKKALGLFTTAAHNGHAKSMNLLARFLEEGWETPRDKEAALVWYRKSAEGGDYRGCHNYATALVDAGHVNDALHWWWQALPDATSDILLAMDRALTGLGEAGDPTLYTALQERLQTLPPHAQPASVTS
ncbi:MAG: tetratricopeptide repeat protein [Acetobacter malorum]